MELPADFPTLGRGSVKTCIRILNSLNLDIIEI